jgi:hypothetical protein
MLNLKNILYLGLAMVFHFALHWLGKQNNLSQARNTKNIEKEFLSECESIFRTRCIQCHSLDRIKQTEKGAEWWAACTIRTSEKPGADLTKDDLRHIPFLPPERNGASRTLI